MNIRCNHHPVSCDDLILESMKLAQMANDQRLVHQNYSAKKKNMMWWELMATIGKLNKNELF